MTYSADRSEVTVTAERYEGSERVGASVLPPEPVDGLLLARLGLDVCAATFGELPFP
jgi:hypothetical protein